MGCLDLSFDSCLNPIILSLCWNCNLMLMMILLLLLSLCFILSLGMFGICSFRSELFASCLNPIILCVLRLQFDAYGEILFGLSLICYYEVYVLLYCRFWGYCGSCYYDIMVHYFSQIVGSFSQTVWIMLWCLSIEIAVWCLWYILFGLWSVLKFYESCVSVLNMGHWMV